MCVCIGLDSAQLVGVDFLTSPLINYLLTLMGVFLQDFARCLYIRSGSAFCLAPQCKHKTSCRLLFPAASDLQKCFHIGALKEAAIRSIGVNPAQSAARSSTNNSHLIPLMIDEVLFVKIVYKIRGRKLFVLNNTRQPDPSSSLCFFCPRYSHRSLRPSL